MTTVLKTKTILLGAAAAMALAACVPGGYTGANNPDQSPNANRNSGAITGALIGGAIGATRKGDEKLTKAAAGAIVGGLVGGAIGAQLDRQAQELRRDLTTNGVSVVRSGNQLIVTMPQDVLFATDSASVRPDLQRDLYTLAGSLNRYPDTTVEVIGHTDNTGTAAYNLQLSQRRAQAVSNILVDAGVPGYRVVPIGRGESQPIASNLTPEGRQANRRVEFVIRPNR
ncbi:OmpA family protein [Thioclava atlantica]|uniref:OmpA family protein n=1 Tax=Thioclava atlantica TaxID=1317124 RepID=A0A085TZD7_9RHOB|nr:OmpA family protein [Thioclava atlantica]KFE36084.1 OmpA family protein [Thioclava atlantica]